MIPRISSTPFYRLTIPELSGGINYRDGISLINDNQLFDAKNVWYKDGALRTRSGIKCVTPNELFQKYLENPTESFDGIYCYPNITNSEFGRTHKLIVTVSDSDGIRFYWFYNEEFWYEAAHIAASQYPSQSQPHINVVQFKDKIYCFVSGYYPDDETAPYFIFKIAYDEQQSEWRYQRAYDDINGNDIYVPTIATNCLPVGEQESWSYPPINGDLYEGYNLIGDWCKLIYSTAKPDQETTRMVYALPYAVHVEGLFGKEIKAIITDQNGKEWTHRVTIQAASGHDVEKQSPGDGLYLSVREGSVSFLTGNDSDSDVATVSKDKFLRNNMELFVPCLNSEANYRKVMDMTFSEWFGGGAQGIYGGLHLFMGGNTNDSEKSLVIWSDFNKPLYFSENAYAYVGNTSQRVTAFGKQGDALVIFKENETYATRYSSVDNATSADDVANFAIIDVSASEVVFPMIQVSGFIGCDCPETVQMCRNRLVWTHSSGKVYTMVSANQWSERSILEVSAMVEKKLANEKYYLSRASAADWNGCYVLATINKIFLMDYESYGYANVSSYAKDSDAQTLIPWWVWEFPKYTSKVEPNENSAYDDPLYNDTEESFTPWVFAGKNKMFVINGNLYFWCETFSKVLDQIGDPRTVSWIDIAKFDGEKDVVPVVNIGHENGNIVFDKQFEEKEIPSMAFTKVFDFGSPTIKKSVPRAEVSVGANGGSVVDVSIVTENGTDETAITFDGEESDDRSPRFFEGFPIRNGFRHAKRIGFKFECDGNICIDALSILYKHLGGAK